MATVGRAMKHTGGGLVLGVGLGCAFSLLFHSWIGMGIGIGIGLLLGASSAKRAVSRKS